MTAARERKRKWMERTTNETIKKAALFVPATICVAVARSVSGIWDVCKNTSEMR
jgi:hypothetical protein